MFHSQNHAVVHKESATGQEIVAENTANAPLELRIYGASRQEQNAEPASPSPDYPSEIVSAVDFEVGSVGRNLLDPAWGNLTSQTLSGITMTRQNDLLVLDGTCTYGNSYFVFGSMNPPYLGYPYTLKAGKTYRLSKTVVSGTAENNQNFEVVISASDLDGSNRASHGLRAESRTLGPYDVDKRINFLRFDVYKGAILSDYTLAVQLEEGETATAYTPYRGNIATINQPLRGIPDGSGGWVARDYIEVKDGAVRLVRECGETAFDGTEEWHDYIATFDTVSHRLLHKDLAPALCTHGRYGGRYKGIFFGWASVDDIGFYPSRIGVDSVAGWQAWLAAQNTAGSPVKVVYALVTPQITDITATDLGGALLSMKSVQYYTRIYHNSTLPVELEAAVTTLGR